MAFQIPYLFTRYAIQAIHIKILIFNNKIPVFWIIFNSFDLQSSLVSIFAKVRYKNNNFNNSIKQFRQITITINLIIVTKFLETICIAVFKYLLNAKSQKNGLLKLVSIYFEKLKTNN